ncbi:MAG: hypothetical protein WCW17_02025 [Patescibacteria group bacterium]|jgi:hypothetical protein
MDNFGNSQSPTVEVPKPVDPIIEEQQSSPTEEPVLEKPQAVPIEVPASSDVSQETSPMQVDQPREMPTSSPASEISDLKPETQDQPRSVLPEATDEKGALPEIFNLRKARIVGNESASGLFESFKKLKDERKQ